MVCSPGCSSPTKASGCCGSRSSHSQDNLTGQLALDSQVPLVDLGISRRVRAQVVIVGVAPICERAILLTLRARKTAWKRVLQRCRLRCKIIVRKEHRGGLAEGCTCQLVVGGRTHSEIDACSASYYRLQIKLIREP